MPDQLPTPILLLWALLMLAGLGLWLALFTNKQGVFNSLEEGGVWLDWRPLPPGLGWCMLIAYSLGLLLQLLVFQPLLGEIPLTEIPPSLMMALSIATVQLPVTLAVFWYIPRHRMPLREALGLHGVWKWKPWLQGLGGYCLALPVLYVAGGLVLLAYELLGRTPENQLSLDSLSRIRHPAEMILIVIFVAGIVPFCEEVIFRGVLYPLLLQRLGAWYALILHSALFALIHLHVPGLLSLFLLSMLLGLVYQKTKNLMSAVVLHMIFNFMTLVVFFLDHDWGGLS